MTKDDLIALAREGKAHIEVAHMITRYCVTPTADMDYEAIFLSISNEDDSVYFGDAYFTDGVDEIDLTEEDAETLQAAIEQKLGPVIAHDAASCNLARIHGPVRAALRQSCVRGRGWEEEWRRDVRLQPQIAVRPWRRGHFPNRTSMLIALRERPDQGGGLHAYALTAQRDGA